MDDIIGAILVFGILPLMIFLGLHYKPKTKAKTVELVKAMLENDKEVTPEIIRAVGFTPKKRHADLLHGMILIASALALLALAGTIPEEEGEAAMGAIALLPLFIGIAILIFWYFVSRKDQSQE